LKCNKYNTLFIINLPKYFISDLHANILKKNYNTVIGIKLDVKENNYKITRLENTINDLKQSHCDTNIYQYKDKKTWDFPIKTLEDSKSH